LEGDDFIDIKGLCQLSGYHLSGFRLIFKGHQGVRVTLEQMMAFLGLQDDAMTVTEAKDWT